MTFGSYTKLKYRKRDNYWTNSTGTLTYYPEDKTGYSYSAKIFCVIDGKSCFNNTQYSQTTSTHQTVLYDFLKEKGIVEKFDYIHYDGIYHFQRKDTLKTTLKSKKTELDALIKNRNHPDLYKYRKKRIVRNIKDLIDTIRSYEKCFGKVPFEENTNEIELISNDITKEKRNKTLFRKAKYFRVNFSKLKTVRWHCKLEENIKSLYHDILDEYRFNESFLISKFDYKLLLDLDCIEKLSYHDMEYNIACYTKKPDIRNSETLKATKDMQKLLSIIGVNKENADLMESMVS